MEYSVLVIKILFSIFSFPTPIHTLYLILYINYPIFYSTISNYHLISSPLPLSPEQRRRWLGWRASAWVPWHVGCIAELLYLCFIRRGKDDMG